MNATVKILALVSVLTFGFGNNEAKAVLATPASPSQLINQFAVDLPSNGVGKITSEILRADLGYIVNSMISLLQYSNIIACPAAGQYGILPTASGADNVIGWNSFAVKAALTTGNPCIQFLAGQTYTFDSVLQYNFPAFHQKLVMELNGADLYWPNVSGGLYLATNTATSNGKPGQGVSSFSVRDGTFSTGQVNTTNGISAVNSKPILNYWDDISDVSNVTLRGHGEASTNYWSTAINIVSINNLRLDNVTTFGPYTSYAGTSVGIAGNWFESAGCTGTIGTAILTCTSPPAGLVLYMFVYDKTNPTAANYTQLITGISGSTITLSSNLGANVLNTDTMHFANSDVITVIDNLQALQAATGIVIGSDVQGVTVVNSQIGGGGGGAGGGIGINNPSNGIADVGLYYSNNFCESISFCIILQSTGFSDFVFAGANSIFVDDTTGAHPGIFFPGGIGAFEITGGVFEGVSASSVAIDIVGTSSDGTVGGTHMVNFNGGIQLGAGTSGITVIPSGFVNVTTPLTNLGANTVPVVCSGSPTSSFATTPSGIVKHC